jgi:hypothetical protein
VRERRHGAGFDLEALTAGRIGSDLRRENLQGDIAAQPGIARPIDLAHAPGAERGDNFVRAEARARGQGHVGRILTPQLA